MKKFLERVRIILIPPRSELSMAIEITVNFDNVEFKRDENDFISVNFDYLEFLNDYIKYVQFENEFT